MPQVKAIRREVESDEEYENSLPDWAEADREKIIAEIKQSIEENDYKPWTEEDRARARRIARGEEEWPPKDE